MRWVFRKSGHTKEELYKAQNIWRNLSSNVNQLNDMNEKIFVR